MEPTTYRCGAFCLALLSLCPVVAYASADQSAWATLPCIPGWVSSMTSLEGNRVEMAPPGGSRTHYDPLVQFQTTSDTFDCYFDEAGPGVTEVYVGDYPNDRVVKHTIASDLTVTTTPLSAAYGKVWIAADLDLDGQVEVVLQRGDTGMGGNGYLVILSAPDWTLRGHFVFPWMKVYMYAIAIDLDDDPHLEIHATPRSLSGAAASAIIDYHEPSDTFYLRDYVPLPIGARGPAAVGDLDDDGRYEFVTGWDDGYTLCELDGDLRHVGPVAVPYAGYWATTLRPKPDRRLYALLGHSSSIHGYVYQLILANGDNSFEVVELFEEVTGWSGLHPCYAIDADLDGRDEIAMGCHPNHHVYDWNVDLGAFERVWTWDENQTGTFVLWREADCDQDGLPEWFGCNHLNVLTAFEDRDVNVSDVSPPRMLSGITLSGSNPIEPAAEISYTIPPGAGALPVRLQVFGIDGRCIVTLVNAMQSPGTYRVPCRSVFSSCHAPAGAAYLCRLRIGTQDLSRKLIAVR